MDETNHVGGVNNEEVVDQMNDQLVESSDVISEPTAVDNKKPSSSWTIGIIILIIIIIILFIF